MARLRRIPYATVAKLAEEGMSLREIAAEVGFSKSGIDKALRKLGISMAKDVVTRTAQQISDTKLDLIAQNKQIMDSLLDDFHYLQGRMNQGPEDKDRIELEVRKVRISAELRKREGLALQKLEKLYNIGKVARFQQIIVEAIRNADTRTAERILESIERERVIQGSITIDGAVT